PAHLARQTFYPDGSRSFEEIDRLGIGSEGQANLISSKVDVDHYRALPTGGYTKGLPAARRTDVGEGGIPPAAPGRDFFAYRPSHLVELPPMPALARATNVVQRALATGRYAGAIWTQGSPQNEETTYWFNLLVDTTVPIVGSSSQRPRLHISNDGDKNIVDAVDYILSRVWADAEGRNRAGVVMIQEEQVYYSRDVQKADARPGNYVATGGHGGIIGSIGHANEPRLTFVPLRRHTYQSAVNVSRLPREVPGVRSANGRPEVVSVPIKDPQGDLLESAIPKVTIVKDGSYTDDTYGSSVEGEVDIAAQIEKNLRDAPL